MARYSLTSVACSLGLALAVGPLAQTGATGPTLRIDFPVTRDVRNRTSLACHPLLDTDITGSAVKHLTDGIVGKVTAGQDKVSISIEDATTLRFLTGASFEAGTARGAAFGIITNNANELVAGLFNGTSINSFVLNKANGLAIWSKIRSTFPAYDAPTGSISYLQCQ